MWTNENRKQIRFQFTRDALGSALTFRIVVVHRFYNNSIGIWCVFLFETHANTHSTFKHLGCCLLLATIFKKRTKSKTKVSSLHQNVPTTVDDLLSPHGRVCERGGVKRGGAVGWGGALVTSGGEALAHYTRMPRVVDSLCHTLWEVHFSFPLTRIEIFRFQMFTDVEDKKGKDENDIS